MRVLNMFLANDFQIDQMSVYSVSGLVTNLAVPTFPATWRLAVALLIEHAPAELGSRYEVELSRRDPGGDWYRLGGFKVASRTDYETLDDGCALEWQVDRLPFKFDRAGTYELGIRQGGEVLASTRVHLREIAN